MLSPSQTSGQFQAHINCISLDGATPFKIHTPPVKDFGKVYHRGSVNFSYDRGSK